MDWEEVSVAFDGSYVIVNGEKVSEPLLSTALSECEIVTEDNVTTSFEVNNTSLCVIFDRTVALMDGHSMIITIFGTVYIWLFIVVN